MKPSIATIEEEPHLYKTKNDISPDRRVELSALLNQRLASSIDLQLQMKQAHWNVKGPNFIGLHELFDKGSRREQRGWLPRDRNLESIHSRGRGLDCAFHLRSRGSDDDR